MPAGLPRPTLSPRLRRLDFLPTWQAWVLGLGSGALAGAALAGFAPRLLGSIAFLGLLGAAAVLAWSGEPVAVAVERVPSLVDLVPIPGGSFRMGSPESEERRYSNEGPVHEVRISPFECMRLPVTHRLYRQVRGISLRTNLGGLVGSAGDQPVNYVSWFDAVAFCNQLSKREGLAPCYQIDRDNVIWHRAANGYRLLTEAEWEYSCRAGSSTRWSFGENEEALGDHAWFAGSSSGRPQPVGRKKPNAWGLYDMHGNVLEWCWDQFGAYSEAAMIDPSGPSEGQGRVLRGGAFVFSSGDLRSAVRVGDRPGDRLWFIGFRCARGPRHEP